MSQGITVEAVRLALTMHEAQARVASVNIAHASSPDARAMRMDFASIQAHLDNVVSGGISSSRDLSDVAARLRDAEPFATDALIHTDVEIGDMVAATLKYQALAQALDRHFSLMRLSITGRS